MMKPNHDVPERVRLGSITLNVLFASVVVAVVATLFSAPRPPTRWLTVSEFHAGWSPRGHINLSMVIDKREECSKVIVDQTVQPIEDGDVLPRPINLSGRLDQRIHDSPLGTSTVFDQVKPKYDLPPGQYLITIKPLCEKQQTEESASVIALTTDASLAVIDIRPVPPI